MRAKTIKHTCAVFDLDDTLIKSEGLVYAYEDGKFTKTLTAQEYSTYIKKPNENLDFSDFRDGDLIINAPKYKGWPMLKKLYLDDIDIYILTARSPILQPYIHTLLLNNQINISIDNIITIGDDKGDIDIAATKRKILKAMTKEYDEILFFDDDSRNIKLASSVTGIKTHLIEGLSFKRGLDPKDAMETGDIEGRKLEGITTLLNSFGMKLIKIETATGSELNSTTIFFEDIEFKFVFGMYERTDKMYIHQLTWQNKNGDWDSQTTHVVKNGNILNILKKRLSKYKEIYKIKDKNESASNF